MILNRANILKTLIFAAFLMSGIVASPLNASADGSHGGCESCDASEESDMYDKNGVFYTEKYQPGTPMYNLISLIRKPELADDQFVLRLAAPIMYSGCLDMSDYGSEASFTEFYMDITIKPLTIDSRTQPQYAHFQCDLRNKMPVAEIVMTRQALLDNGTKVLRLHNEERTNYFTVDLTEERVLIMPDNKDVSIDRAFYSHALPTREASTIYWFYPMGTLVVWTPQIVELDKAQEYVETFAKNNGLVPLTNYYEGFKSPLYDKKFMYFVDTAGKFENVEGLENGAQIGNITVETVEYGLHGDEPGTEDFMIFARKPGTYD